MTAVLQRSQATVPREHSLAEAGDAQPHSVLPVFVEWCLWREAFSKWTYFRLLLPIVVAGVIIGIQLVWPAYPLMGRHLFKDLAQVAVIFVFIYGVQHASRAVCWEISNELRELVRLTGIDPNTLLWSQTICRWWTIGLAVATILPLVMYARLLGGITPDQWLAAICWLMLLGLLTGGFAMIASVSSGRANNADNTASTATFLLMLGYHFLFWAFGAAVYLVAALVNGSFNLPADSYGVQLSLLSFQFAPVTQVYQAVHSPEAFTLISPVYWLHFITAICCMRLASIVMFNRFRTPMVVSHNSTLAEPTTGMETPAPNRPRCSQHPFFWKDRCILGGGTASRSWWLIVSVCATIGVLLAETRENAIAAGMIAIIIAPWIIAFQFDGLMTVEFREQTWSSLMALPIDPRVPVLAKLFAAVTAVRSLFVPVIIAVLLAFRTHPGIILMAIPISLLACLMLIEISILSQFNRKLWWAGPVVGVGVLFLIGFLIAFWIVFPPAVGFLMTMLVMTGTVAATYSHIHLRLRNWSEA